MLSTYITQVLYENANKEDIELIKSKMKGDEREMLRLSEVLRKEKIEQYHLGEQRGKAIGLRDGIKEIAKKMIKENTDIDYTCRITSLDKEEIEKLRLSV